MSNEVNTDIWERACERAEEEGLDPWVFSEMELDLEDAFEYLMSGKVPEGYEEMEYRIYKL